MTTPNSQKSKILSVAIPLFGICIFTILYVAATFLYPGGSNTDKAAKGFSWLHNYWCDLAAPYAKNGEINSAQPVAIIALLILSASLSVFWYYVPSFLNFTKRTQWAVQYAGVLSVIFIIALPFITYHDLFINIAAAFGCIPFIGTFIGLYKSKYFNLFYFGVFCLIMIVMNNYIYYTNNWISYLPVIQKITFFFFLFWISLIDILIYRKIKSA